MVRGTLNQTGGPSNKGMNLTRSAQTDWGPCRLFQCWADLSKREGG